jgi:uncharacterized spore protein YtfJ
MEITAEQFTTPVQEEVMRAAKKLEGRGVIFGEALQEGKHTLIPVMKTMVRGSAVVTRPVAVIVVSGDKVRVKHFLKRNIFETLLLILGITMLLGTVPVVMYPPWRPGESLLVDVARLLKTIREGNCC